MSDRPRPTSMATCWTLIHAVHGGDRAARSDFVERYLPAVQAYLKARWSKGPLGSECDDAAHEVFVRCFSDAGPLDRLPTVSKGGFRSFLFGVTRNVAREIENDRRRRPRAEGGEAIDVAGENSRLSAVFDRQFARQVMREARARYQETASQGDEAARARLEILALRFDQNMPIRDIAKARGEDAARIHKEYARARREFRESLLEIVGEQNPDRSISEVQDFAKHLVELLG